MTDSFESRHPKAPLLNVSSSYYYLDGNAVTFLWDRYTQYKKEGSSNDPIALSPFVDAVVSEYTLDELITIPIGTAYKKHLCFLMIFQELPVFTSITKFDAKTLNNSREGDILLPSDFLPGLVTIRSLALASPEYRGYLEQDIQSKEQARIGAELFLKNPLGGYFEYVDPKKRISLRETIIKIIQDHQLTPSDPYDFYQLCMHLFVATRNRLIDVPAKYRKGPSRTLSHQIDFYHLSYLPFVKGFVTSDTYLSLVARELVSYLDLKREILNKEDFWKRWIKTHLVALDDA